MPRTAALIPGFEVEDTIGEVVRGARAHAETVLVVDDGSTDHTAVVAEGAGAQVLRHPNNCGKGAALRNGMEHLRARGFTHALSLDGDGQHLPSEMSILLEASSGDPEAIIVGVRQRQDDQEIAGIRRFGNGFANWWVSLAAGCELPDTQSGFRVYPLHSTLELGVRTHHYQFESEVLILAVRNGLAVRSREIRVHYPPPSELVSHYKPWLDTIRIIRTVVPFAAGWRR